jgi:hypothetical protein
MANALITMNFLTIFCRFEWFPYVPYAQIKECKYKIQVPLLAQMENCEQYKSAVREESYYNHARSMASIPKVPVRQIRRIWNMLNTEISD